ncbi:hypothetical protein P4S72_06340 [Vibrio sp. PP-XX7]
MTYTNPGNIGLFTNNRSFEMDYIKVGDPSIKPVQLSLDYGHRPGIVLLQAVTH